MRAVVIRAFKDAQNAEKLYREGDSFEGSDERISQLEELGFVKATKVAKSQKKAAKPQKAKPQKAKLKD
ncbi:MAG: hypothetical protein IJ125_05035 [Atopobiaceae bacterium]|nr:hypothetical protein [Atopobiaceae bacterium]